MFLTVVPLKRFDDRPEHWRAPAPVVVQGPVEEAAPQVRDEVPHSNPGCRGPQCLYRRRLCGRKRLRSARGKEKEGLRVDLRCSKVAWRGRRLLDQQTKREATQTARGRAGLIDKPIPLNHPLLGWVR